MEPTIFFLSQLGKQLFFYVVQFFFLSNNRTYLILLHQIIHETCNPQFSFSLGILAIYSLMLFCFHLILFTLDYKTLGHLKGKKNQRRI